MDKPQFHQDSELSAALRLTRQALGICDEQGFIFAAIHLCSAIEALEALQEPSVPFDNP